MIEIKTGLKSVASKEKWAARGASFVAKAKATKVVWFPPKPVDTGTRAAATVTKATSQATKKAGKRTAARTTGAAKKATSSTKKVTNPARKKS